MVTTRSTGQAQSKSPPRPKTPAAAAGASRQSFPEKPRSNGLEAGLKKLLIVDIEKAGGIAKFGSPDTEKLLNKRSEFSDKEVRRQARSFISSCRRL